MASNIHSRASGRFNENLTSSSKDRHNDSRHRSATSWGDNAAPIIAAVLGGAAIGVAANYGRKALVQGIEARAGDWDEILRAEHAMALALFEKMLATDQTQTFKRNMLLMKLTHALDKHSHAEEMIIYPALRADEMACDADHLEGEHGYIKTFIYELNKMGADSPKWLDKIREFRDFVDDHAKMEELQIFPAFKRSMSDKQNAELTSLVNRDGYWMA